MRDTCKQQRTPFSNYNRIENHPIRKNTFESTEKESNYQIAKYYEYSAADRDLDKALYFYHRALEAGEKKDSTIKDLAGVLHQKGKTQEAVNFLKSHRKQYRGDLQKYDNLIENLRRQIQLPSGKNLNRFILVLNMDRDSLKYDVESLFLNSNRINSIHFYKDLSFTQQASQSDIPYILIEFASYSAAKKTVDTFQFSLHPEIQLYWVNVNRLLICEVSKGKEDLFKLNSYYFGAHSFNTKLFIILDSEFFSEDTLRDKKIKQIWGKDEEMELSSRRRLNFQNLTKLELLRSKRV